MLLTVHEQGSRRHIAHDSGIIFIFWVLPELPMIRECVMPSKSRGRGVLGCGHSAARARASPPQRCSRFCQPLPYDSR